MAEPYQDPIQSVIQGMLQGHQIAQQIHQQRQQDEAYARHNAQQDQESSIRDIMTRMNLEQNARPINGGTVTQEGSELPGVLGLPGSRVPDLVRKADPSRTVKYKNSQGEQQSYELYTPQEQDQRADERAIATKRAGLVQMQTPAHLAQIFGPTMWVDPHDAPQMINSVTESAPYDVPTAGQDLGLPAQMPAKNIPQILSTIAGEQNRSAADARSQAAINAANQRAADAAASREKVAAGNNTAANSRSTAANASREKAAAIRAVATGNGQGVQNRFDQRELDRIDQQEAALHATRLNVGQQLTQGVDDKEATIGKGKAALLGAKYKAASDDLQRLQLRKAQLHGMQPPPPEIIGKIPEGQQATGPDGHTWKKQDGILYLIK